MGYGQPHEILRKVEAARNAKLLRNAGVSLSEISRVFGIERTNIRKWIKDLPVLEEKLSKIDHKQITIGPLPLTESIQELCDALLQTTIRIEAMNMRMDFIYRLVVGREEAKALAEKIKQEINHD